MSGKRKGQTWTQEEDDKLTKLVHELSCPKCDSIYRPDCECKTFTKAGTWKGIAQKLNRSYGGCQGRWNGVLDPKLDSSPWTPEMDARLLKLYTDPKTPTWVTRARALSKPGVRRNGADVCERYFALKKQPKKKGAKKDDKATEEAVDVDADVDIDADADAGDEETTSTKKKGRAKRQRA